MKRLCIKTLPPVLVIQLKRFGYDWEAGRALKFDDHFEVKTFTEVVNVKTSSCGKPGLICQLMKPNKAETAAHGY